MEVCSNGFGDDKADDRQREMANGRYSSICREFSDGLKVFSTLILQKIFSKLR